MEEEEEAYRDIRAGGYDGGGVILRMGEGGDAEVRSEAETPLARRHVGVSYVHHFVVTTPNLVLKVCFLVLCLEFPFLLIPHYLVLFSHLSLSLPPFSFRLSFP